MSLIKTSWHDTEDGGAVVVREQQVNAIVDDCKARHNEGKWQAEGVKHVARIPNVVIEHYCNVNNIKLSEFIRNEEHIKRLCEDPAFSDLRIWPGKL
jgi:hypothetical protein